MAAWMYEGLLLFAVCALTGLVFSFILNSRHALTHRVALQILLFGMMGGYFSWFWSRGQTLAMKTWKIKLLTAQGKSVSLGQAFKRYLWAWLWFFPPLLLLAFTELNKSRLAASMIGWVGVYLCLAWLHPSKQFLHDRLAGTRLIDTQP